MPAAIVWIFLFFSSMLAAVHSFAVTTALYWYYSWFDIVMHVWGGMLVVLGVHALCTLKHIPMKPSFVLIFGTLITLIIVWEVFEWSVGLYDPNTYLYDVSKDVIVGLIGGLIGYVLFVRFRM